MLSRVVVGTTDVRASISLVGSEAFHHFDHKFNFILGVTDVSVQILLFALNPIMPDAFE